MNDVLAARDVPFLRDVALPRLRTLRERWFRATANGLEHLPATGPALIVMTHSAGPLLIDSVLALSFACERNGAEAPYYALVHDFIMGPPPLRRLMERAGALRAHPDVAAAALKGGAVVVATPGGGDEAFRSFRRRNQVNFQGRTGFARLAIELDVPIIPAASVGAHEAYLTLFTSRRLARWTGLSRLRINSVPITLSMPWGLTLGFMPFVPLPTQVSFQMGAPLRFGGDPTDREHVRACAAQVEQTIQRMTDDLASKRRFPVLG